MDNKKSYGWVIAANKPVMRDFLVYATKKEEREEWMEAIEEVIQWIAEGHLVPSRSRLRSPVAPASQQEKEDAELACSRFYRSTKQQEQLEQSSTSEIGEPAVCTNYSAVNTTQHNTTQHNTTQHNTTQTTIHNTTIS